MTSLIDADSLLVVDVGSVTTRASLFDVVDGRYRFLAAGKAPSTAGAPFHDVSEGVRQAIDHLQAITGRTLVDSSERLVMPAAVDGTGVDTFAATFSAGAPLRILAVGLLEDVTLDSARRLATTTYCGKLETISLNDRRRTEGRIDAIVRMRPDLVLVAGGTENGASQSVIKLVEAVGLACFLIPEQQRPEVLYAGNSALKGEVKDMLGNLVSLHFAPNLRPDLDVEQIEPAQVQINNLYRNVRIRQIPGVQDLDSWAGGALGPTSAAFGRIIRFLSKARKSNTTPKGVLGVDVGSSATTLAAAFGGEMNLAVYPELGIGHGVRHLLEQGSMTDITRWLPVEIQEDQVREYVFNKSLYPATIPATSEDLAIEEALARQAMRVAVTHSIANFPRGVVSPGPGLLPWFEPIVATGGVLAQSPNLAHTLLMLLDGLQPTGATTIVLDQNGIAAALGAAAVVNPLVPVQVMDTSAFHHLGTVIAPVGHARPGTPILRVKMTYQSGHETTLDVKQGALETIPLPLGQTARLHLQPLHRYDVGMGSPGRSGSLQVTGGALGIVIDARGRPLQLPNDAGRRRELIKKWLWTLGG